MSSECDHNLSLSLGSYYQEEDDTYMLPFDNKKETQKCVYYRKRFKIDTYNTQDAMRLSIIFCFYYLRM